MKLKIVFITAFILVCGFFSQLLPILITEPYSWQISAIHFLWALAPKISTVFFGSTFYANATLWETGYIFQINYLAFPVYILLFIGFVWYIVSKGKEVRLLRFLFSFLLFFHIFSALWSLIFIKGNIKILTEDYGVINGWIYTISPFFWTIVFYYMLQKLSKETILDGMFPKEDSTYLIQTSKAQRFLHLAVDTFLVFWIGTTFLAFLLVRFPHVSSLLSSLYREKFLVYLVIFIARYVYYIFFELIFKRTPGKFLTGSVIVMQDGTTPNAKTILLRNLARFIPFEPFSYFGKGNGWHDTLLGTQIVKERNKSISFKKYFLILMTFILLSGLLVFAIHKYKENNRRQAHLKFIHEQDVSQIATALRLENITDYFFYLTKTDFLGDQYYLKAESVQKDSVVFAYFQMKQGSFASIQEIRQFYEDNIFEINTIKIAKTDLKKFYAADFESSEENAFPIFPESPQKYHIDEIYREKGVFLQLESRYFSSISTNGPNKVAIRLKNRGISAQITEIKNLEGDLDWSEEYLPKEISRFSKYNTSYVELYFSNFQYRKPYKFLVTTVDSLNQKEQFLFEGINLDIKMTVENKK
ncbi:RDD family protein [Capnocytophaga canimorsus]|uniref:RDD family protein n=1 Tax=Capnocytophaga canimorsus TaxID=28188 RepID=UPI00385F7621